MNDVQKGPASGLPGLFVRVRRQSRQPKPVAFCGSESKRGPLPQNGPVPPLEKTAPCGDTLILPCAPGRAVGPPAKPEACVSFGKAYCPASLSGGAEFSLPCITFPASRKRGPSRCVLQLFDIEYRPASLGTDSEIPFTLPGTAGGVSLKPKNRTGACRAPILHVGNQLPGSGERLVPKPESPEKARRRNKGTAGKAQGPFRHMA